MLSGKGKILLCCLMLLLVTGCSGKNTDESEKSEKFQSDYMELFLAQPVKMEEGYFEIVDGLSYYIDYETKMSVPICNEPECRHLSEAEDTNTTCDAANGDASMVFPHKGRLLKIVVDKDGDYTILASELDGSNEKEVGNVTTDNRMIHEAVIVKNNMYYTYSKMAEMNEGFGESAIKRDFGITRLNLDTMETEDIYEDKDVELLMMLGGTSKFQMFSASKASADLFVLAYHRTYGMPVTVSRCSNNYGPYHFPEKLIPLIISRALADEELPVYGTGENVRDWLHVSDHCEAIDLIIHKGRVGEVYNIGGHNERTNLEVVKTILKALNKPESLIKFVTDRPGHDRRYAIDPTKIETELGWKPKYNFDTGIQQTIQWYLDNQEWWKNILSGEYSNYFDKMYGNRL